MAWGDRLLSATWEAFPSLARNQIALTWLVYDPPAPIHTGGALTPEEFWCYSPRGFSYRGVERIDPASMVTLFYLMAVHEWLERGMLQPSGELERAMTDMMLVGSHDATSFIVDLLTGTTSGPDIAADPFVTWKYQRNIINRYLESFSWTEFQTINVNQKTWGNGPYGRERAFLGELLENRNMLTTIATARLLHSIVGGVTVSPTRSQAMMNLLQRTLNPDQILMNLHNQVVGFLGSGLPIEARLWSKVSETSQVRHDAAYIELPNSLPYLLIVFIEGKDNARNESILPFISRQIVSAMQTLYKTSMEGFEPPTLRTGT